jgi:hypothetical protein
MIRETIFIMKKLILLGVVASTLLACKQTPSATHITEENYLKADSALWAEFERDTEPLIEQMDAEPERFDALYELYLSIEEATDKKNVELAMEYAAVPSGLRRMYMVRNDIDKKLAQKRLSEIPDSMQQSYYGQLIKQFIEAGQVEEGDKYQPFECTGTDGQMFDWSRLDGKKILLLYGGLGCMGQEGRDLLKKWYEQYSRDDFQTVIYTPGVGNYEELVEDKRYWMNNGVIDYIAIADFLGDASPIRIIYGSQAKPTCFMIDRDGRVVIKSEGLNIERMEAFLKQ